MDGALKNVAANILGLGWAALMGICFVPLYLKFIGVEGYDLIGFFVILSHMALCDKCSDRFYFAYPVGSRARRLEAISGVFCRGAAAPSGLCNRCWGDKRPGVFIDAGRQNRVVKDAVIDGF